MKLCRYLLATALVASLALTTTGCSLFGGEEDTVLVAPSPVTETSFPLTQTWSNSVSSSSKVYSLLSPAESENVVFAAGRSGHVKAIDLASGKTKWNIDVSNSSLFRSQSALLSGGITVDNQYVFVGSERAVLYAIDKNTGTLVWQKDVKGEVLAKPVSTEDKVIVHTANGYLQALARDTGNSVWEMAMDVPTLSLRGQSSPVVAYGAIIVGDDNGRVNAYFAKDGQLIWQQRISQPSGSTEIAKLNDVDIIPFVEQGLVYAVGYNGNLAALDLSNGQTVWKKALGSTHNFAINQNRIFAIDQDDNLVSLAKNGGTVIWKQSDLLHRQLTDPVIFKDYIVVGDFEGYLYLIDMNSGNVVSKTQVNSSGLASKPIVVDNKIIIQAKNGNVYAYSQQ